MGVARMDVAGLLTSAFYIPLAATSAAQASGHVSFHAASPLDDTDENFDPERVLAAMTQREKSGGRDERSIAIVRSRLRCGTRSPRTPM